MNELQNQAIKELKDKNDLYIEDVDAMKEKIQTQYEEFKKFKEDFFGLMEKMERANSQVPFLPYCNAYCMKDGEFSIPVRPCISDNLYGTVNEEYKFLSDKYMTQFEDELNKDFKNIREMLEENIAEISEKLDEIIASNSITKRLSGLEEQAVKLEKNKDIFWYPQKLSQNEYQWQGNIVVPACIQSMQPVTPFHRRLLIKYDYLFKTMSLHEKILSNIKATLLYINGYLPFAELIPLKVKEDGGISIINNNTVTPKQVQLGSENKFDGEINIGNEGELKDGD
ncbi:hypothetical protein [Clostridium butyricum]|nr:hypothetical protein [Clostridium butyricum]AXB86046.1 hypothetical protein DRB99_14005 [Clostridium butyricum]